MAAVILKVSLLIFMTILGALGGYFFKKATSNGIGFQKSFLINFIIGGILYSGGAIFNIILLKYVPYTIVYPLTAITYVWSLIIAYFFLSEKITKRKWIGVSFIIVGALVISM